MLPTWFIMASLRYQLLVLPPKSCFCSTCHILWSKWPWKVRSYFAFSLSSIRHQHIHSCLCRLLSIYFVFVSYCNISFNHGLHLWCPRLWYVDHFVLCAPPHQVSISLNVRVKISISSFKLMLIFSHILPQWWIKPEWYILLLSLNLLQICNGEFI